MEINIHKEPVFITLLAEALVRTNLEKSGTTKEHKAA